MLAVDTGLSRCKLGMVSGASVSRLSIIEDVWPRFFSDGGYARLCAHLVETIRVDAARKPEGLALAIPLTVDYARDVVGSGWLAGWPSRVRQMEDWLVEEGGLPTVVLNDAVAFALGSLPLATEYGPQSTVCLTVGTNFGGALLHGVSIAQPLDLNELLAHTIWPNGLSGFPSRLMRWQEQQPLEEREYGRITGWVIGRLQQHTRSLPVVLGGGRTRSILVDDVLRGIREVGADAVSVRLDANERVALVGAARLWSEVVEHRRPIAEMIRDQWRH